MRDRSFFDWPDRLTGFAVQNVEERLFARLRHRLDRTPVDDDVDQDGSARHVEAPDRMVDELEMPASFSGVQVNGDETFPKEIVTRAMAAVVVA